MTKLNLWLVPLVAVMTCASCVTTRPSTQGDENPDEDSQPVASDVAKKIDQALREASFLEIAGTITQTDLIGDGKGVRGGTTPLSFKMWMTESALRAEVEQEGKLVAAFAWYEGRFQEFRPQVKNAPLIEYNEPQPYGTDDTVLKADIDCRLAPLTDSWVDDDSHYRNYFVRKVIEGKFTGRQQIGAHQCLVFHHSEPSGLEGGIYVDEATFLVVRRDATMQDILRSMVLDRIQVLQEAPPGFQWKLQIQNNELVPCISNR